MMRFVDLGTQLHLSGNGPRQFAYFNTVSDVFLEFSGAQVWSNWKEFTEDFRHDKNFDEKSTGTLYQRLSALRADWVPE